jgi:hypothetical protein
MVIRVAYVILDLSTSFICRTTLFINFFCVYFLVFICSVLYLILFHMFLTNTVALHSVYLYNSLIYDILPNEHLMYMLSHEYYEITDLFVT